MTLPEHNQDGSPYTPPVQPEASTPETGEQGDTFHVDRVDGDTVTVTPETEADDERQYRDR